jgi:hypothetical protein
MSVGGGGSKSESEQGLGTLGFPLWELFGVGTRGGKQGFQPDPGGRSLFTNQVFDRDSFANLAGITDPISARRGIIDTSGLLDRTSDFQRELMDTGLKTDIQPAVDLSSRLFREEFVPGALEQFGIRGLDARDSDVSSALLREGSRRATELGALDLDLQEAATGRRMQGAQGASGLLGLESQALGLEAQALANAFAESPAGQLLNRFLQLTGINTQAGGVGSSKSKSAGGQLALSPSAPTTAATTGVSGAVGIG